MDEQTLFTAALDLNPDRRSAFLEEACGSDRQLRERVEQLLELHAEAGDFLESPATGNIPTLAGCVAERPGTLIGPYKLLEQIGEGGFGVVYRAKQQQPVRRQVALKIVKPGMDTHQVIARFEAERQALALMDHPQIARVLDAGATDSGRPYFVMELVKGIPITEYCDQCDLTTQERLELFIAVCQAVQHAHQKGIIHRDLKPSNVMVAIEDGKPAPKVIDFGVAKAINQRLTERTLMTGYDQMIGTPLYMSPEQAEMSPLEVDTRSDIYSLGVLLYELLTGTTPFEKNRLSEANYDELRRIIREKEPPRPSARISTLDAAALTTVAERRRTHSKRLQQLVRGDLDWIVMKCLEKDRTRRYETADALCRDLQRYLNDDPVLACPPSFLYRFRKFARRKKRTLAIISVVAFAVLFATATLGWAVRDRRARDEAIARDRSVRLLALEQQVAQSLEGIQKAYQEGKLPEAMEALRRAEGLLAGAGEITQLDPLVRKWRSDLETVARLEQIRLEGTISDQGRWDWSRADQDFREVFHQYGLDVEKLDPSVAAGQIQAQAIGGELAFALDAWVDVRRAMGDPDDEMVRKLLAVAQAVDPDPVRSRLRSLWAPGAVHARDELGRLAASLSDTRLPPTTVVPVARTLYEALPRDAIALLRECQRRYPGDFWTNYELGIRLRHRDAEDAVGFCRAALALRPDNPAVHVALANALSDSGKDNRYEAETEYREAILLQPGYPAAYHGLSDLLIVEGRFREAIEQFRVGIQGVQESAHLKNQLAWLLVTCPDSELRSPATAVALAKEAVKAKPELGYVWNTLGWAKYYAGNYNEALEALDHSIALDGGKAHDWFIVAMAHERLGHHDEARRWFYRALSWMEKFEPKEAAIYRAHWTAEAPPADWKPKPLFSNGVFYVCVEAEAVLGETLLSQAYAHSARRQWDQAALIYDQVLSFMPVPEDPWSGTRGVLDAAVAFEQVFERLAERRPRDRSLRVARINHLGRQRRWKEATDLLATLIELDASDYQSWYLASVLYLASGDLESYQRVCREMLDRFGNTADPMITARIALSCLLAPQAVSDLEMPRKLAERAVTARPATGWFHLVKGAAEYRAGNCEPALEQLQLVLAQPDGELYVEEAAWTLRAMAEQQLARYEQARRSLAQAQEQIAARLPSGEGGELDDDWDNWLRVDLLRREAEALVGSRVRGPVLPVRLNDPKTGSLADSD